MIETIDAKQACEWLHEAADLNRDDPEREGSLLNFGAAGQLVMTGDLHGHLRNFHKLQRFCRLAQSPARKVILHELIHTEPTPPENMDLSIDVAVQAAKWKCEFPDNVFFLQSNHELSQLHGQEITKAGRCVLHDFEVGVEHRFGDDAGKVLTALEDYISSLALAAKTAKGLFLSHSLPEPAVIKRYDLSVFDRMPTIDDLRPGGPGYQLVWGRFQTEDDLNLLAEKLGVETFVVGHTPQEEGYKVVARMLIMASDHAHGVFLPIDLSKSYTAEQLATKLQKFVAVE